MAGDRHIRLIALDLDGTLLDEAKRISPRNRDALRRAVDTGVTVALASGRMTDCIAPTADALGIDCPIIAYNGAMARGKASGGRPVLFHRPLEAQYTRELVDFCRGRYHLNLYFDDMLYSEERPSLRRFAEIYSTRTGARYNYVPDLARFDGRDTTKAIIIVDHPERERLHDEWAARLGPGSRSSRPTPSTSSSWSAAPTRAWRSRGSARRSASPSRRPWPSATATTMREMLAAAGLGVAMANASAKTLAAADEVSPLTNNQDAVADAVERHVLAGR